MQVKSLILLIFIISSPLFASVEKSYQQCLQSFVGILKHHLQEQVYQDTSLFKLLAHHSYHFNTRSKDGRIESVKVNFGFNNNDNEAELSWMETTEGLRGKGLSIPVIQHFLKEYPHVERIEAVLIDVNSSRFIAALSQYFNLAPKEFFIGKTEMHNIIYYHKNILPQIRELENKDEIIKQALMKTPIYKSLAHFGFNNIEYSFYEGHTFPASRLDMYKTTFNIVLTK